MFLQQVPRSWTGRSRFAPKNTGEPAARTTARACARRGHGAELWPGDLRRAQGAASRSRVGRFGCGEKSHPKRRCPSWCQTLKTLKPKRPKKLDTLNPQAEVGWSFLVDLAEKKSGGRFLVYLVVQSTRTLAIFPKRTAMHRSLPGGFWGSGVQAVGQNPVPPVNIQIAGKSMFIHPKMETLVLPHGQISSCHH